MLINISASKKMNTRNIFIFKLLFRFYGIIFRGEVDIYPELFYN